MVRWHISRAYLCSPRLGLSTDRVGEPLFSLLRALPNGWFSALPNRCFFPGHMWSSRLSRGLTWAVHGPRGRTPCRTLVFGRAALPNRCFCPGHMCVSRLSRGLTSAVHGPRGRTAVFEHGRLAELLFLALPPCRTAVFGPDTRAAAVFPGDLGRPRTTWADRCLSARTPGRTAVFGPRAP